MKTSQVAAIALSICLCLPVHAGGLPAFPHAGVILLDAGTRANISFENMSDLDQAKCKGDYSPIPVVSSVRFSIGSETYLVKDWTCIADPQSPKEFSGYILNAFNEYFDNHVTLTVKTDSVSLIDSGVNHPVKVLSRY